MRLLWLGNPPFVGSGYGEQANIFVPRLRALGHDLAVAANYGLQATKLEWNGLTVYPSDGQWGNTSIGTYAEHYNADFVVALCDAWVMKPQLWPDDLRMAIWTPVDHWPIPPSVLAVLQDEKVIPIAMSRFGEEWMRKFSLDPIYIPHGVDTDVFYPRPEIRDQVRDELSIPRDVFLVGMVAANKGNPMVPRKSFPQAFDAFARFAEKHKDAWMYVHTEAQPQGSGMSLDTLARAVGCPEKRVRFPPEQSWQLGMTRDVVAALYQAFDVLLNPSMGEGFGVPILEAQASGCPVIASDHSAMSELTQAGWLVTGDRWWDALQESFLIVPAIDSIRMALEAAYDSRGDQKLRAAGVEFAQQYDADVVTVQYWEPALERLAKPREVPPLPNRKMRRALAKAA